MRPNLNDKLSIGDGDWHAICPQSVVIVWPSQTSHYDTQLRQASVVPVHAVWQGFTEIGSMMQRLNVSGQLQQSQHRPQQPPPPRQHLPPSGTGAAAAATSRPQPGLHLGGPVGKGSEFAAVASQQAEQRRRLEARLKELNMKASQMYEQRRKTEHVLPDGGAQVRGTCV